MNYRHYIPAILSSLSLTLYGCSTIQMATENPRERKIREMGFDPNHAQSCGPYALEDLLEKLEINTESELISKDIVENSTEGNLLRGVLGIFSARASEITWPHEIRDYLKRNLESRGYRICKIEKSPDIKDQFQEILKKGEKGIVRLSKKGNIFSQHWMAFPNPINPETRYEEDTLIEEIYVVEKK